MTDGGETTFCQKNINTVEWEIQDYPALKYDIGKCISSPTFWVYCNCWQIHLHPKGYYSYDKGVPLFVEHTTCNTVLPLVQISLKIDDTVVESRKFKNYFKEGYGSRRFIEQLALLKMLKESSSKKVNIECTFLNLFYKDEKTVGKQNRNDTFKNLAEDFGNGLSNTYLSDVTIIIGPKRKEFQAHKLALASRSPFFASKFKRGKEEYIKGIVVIPDCNPVVFEQLMEFIYSGEIHNVVKVHLLRLYRLADECCITDLIELCSKWLAESLEVVNICAVLNLADTFGDKKLIKAATTFFLDNALEILETDMWIEFMEENASIARHIWIKHARQKDGLEISDTESDSDE